MEGDGQVLDERAILGNHGVSWLDRKFLSARPGIVRVRGGRDGEKVLFGYCRFDGEPICPPVSFFGFSFTKCTKMYTQGEVLSTFWHASVRIVRNGPLCKVDRSGMVLEEG